MAEPVRAGLLLGLVPGMSDRLAEARLLAAWPTIAGPAAARSRADGIEHGLLQVAVDGSGWLHRLTLEEPRLAARCREIAAIRGICFRLAPGASRPPPSPAGLDAAEGEGHP